MQSFMFNGQEVRTETVNGVSWLAATDVCAILGLKNPTMAVRPLADDQRITLRISEGIRRGNPYLAFISESGFYKLAMRCQSQGRPGVAEFQDWVTRAVLPAIRKDGMYVKGEEKVATGEMTDDELELLVYERLKAKVARMKEERDAARAEVDALAPKADGFDRFCNSEGSTATTELAAQIGFTDARELHETLRANGMIYPSLDSEQRIQFWRIKKAYAHSGFHVVKTIVVGPRREKRHQLRWTAAGCAYIAERFGRH